MLNHYNFIRYSVLILLAITDFNINSGLLAFLKLEESNLYNISVNDKILLESLIGTHICKCLISLNYNSCFVNCLQELIQKDFSFNINQKQIISDVIVEKEVNSISLDLTKNININIIEVTSKINHSYLIGNFNN